MTYLILRYVHLLGLTLMPFAGDPGVSELEDLLSPRGVTWTSGERSDSSSGVMASGTPMRRASSRRATIETCASIGASCRTASAGRAQPILRRTKYYDHGDGVTWRAERDAAG
jgi:hypothetical protein